MKKFQRRSLLLAAAALGASATMLSACGGSDDDEHPTQNIVELAQGLPQFSILVEALIAADLATALSGKGPFTVFAPTNDAFAAALTELGVTKSTLLANKPLLTEILKYHVVPSRVLKAQVPINIPITTLQGSTFTVGADLFITDQRARKAQITSTDVLASNGVIHVINKVILPPA
jgi:uncharacterized surface protein with fasciclin (FAS1) repeats